MNELDPNILKRTIDAFKASEASKPARRSWSRPLAYSADVAAIFDHWPSALHFGQGDIEYVLVMIDGVAHVYDVTRDEHDVLPPHPPLVASVG